MLPALPYELSESVREKAAKIKLAAFDVDGVLTDGRLHYGPDGEQLKVFHALDGHGLKMLQTAGILVAVISARQSPALQQRLDDLSIQESHLGIIDKRAVFNRLLAKHGLQTEQCCFTGDDVIDLPVMQECGLKFSVENGHFIVRDLADWIAPLSGGNGAVRAICDLILYCQEAYPLGHDTTQ
jgi:3-deoxy-D-manno-octulosonate 8-phosphate phosphatase, YrbI family